MCPHQRVTPRPRYGVSAFGVLGVFVVISSARGATAQPPIPAASFWEGIGAATTHAPATGVRVLREPPSERIRVPGGTFTMGSTPAGMAEAIQLCEREIRGAECRDDDVLAMVAAEGAAHTVTISAFTMDRTEVTVDKYSRCVSAGSCAPLPFSASDPKFGRPSFPVTHVRWED
ncbi:MAG: formylglycine-generating enzyme family protein, partial [Polyangiaceae bacterium]